MREDIPTPLPAGPATFSATPPLPDFYTADCGNRAPHRPPITAPQNDPKKTHQTRKPLVSLGFSYMPCTIHFGGGLLLPPFARPTSRIAPTSRRSCSPSPRLPLAAQNPAFTVRFFGHFSRFFTLLTLVLLPYSLLSPVGRTALFSSPLPVTW